MSILCKHNLCYEVIAAVLTYTGSRRRSTSFKIGNSRIPPTVRICISLIFSLIMVGFAWGLKQTE